MVRMIPRRGGGNRQRKRSGKDYGRRGKKHPAILTPNTHSPTMCISIFHITTHKTCLLWRLVAAYSAMQWLVSTPGPENTISQFKSLAQDSPR